MVQNHSLTRGDREPVSQLLICGIPPLPAHEIVPVRSRVLLRKNRQQDNATNSGGSLCCLFIHENDPVLEVAALCDATMIDTLAAIEGVVKAAADRTSAAAAQSVDAARETTEAVISQGAAFLVEQFRDIVRDARATMLAELREETAKATRASRLAARIAWGLADLAAIGLAGGFLLSTVGHG